jgi:hypothetical protein
MAEAIADDQAVPDSPKKRKRKRKEKKKAEDTDPEDSDFASSDGDDDSDSGVEEVIPNEEVSSDLPL